MERVRRRNVVLLSRCSVAISLLLVSMTAFAQDGGSPHVVRTTKFTIDNVDTNKAFYEGLVGMNEVDRFVSEGRLIEPFMAFDEGGRVGLLAYVEQEAVEKSPHPVSVFFVPDLDALIHRFEDAKYPMQVFSGEATNGVKVGIARDPSGNAIEFVEREGPPAVGGARLIVDDRKETEDFFVRVFGVKSGQRIETETFDEVFMDFGEGMFVALFEPKHEVPLRKSQHPVVAIYSSEFDSVLERVKAEGTAYRRGTVVREVGTGLFFVNDPSGNVVEVVRQRTP